MWQMNFSITYWKSTLFILSSHIQVDLLSAGFFSFWFSWLFLVWQVHGWRAWLELEGLESGVQFSQRLVEKVYSWSSSRSTFDFEREGHCIAVNVEFFFWMRWGGTRKLLGRWGGTEKLSDDGEGLEMEQKKTHLVKGISFTAAWLTHCKLSSEPFDKDTLFCLSKRVWSGGEWTVESLEVSTWKLKDVGASSKPSLRLRRSNMHTAYILHRRGPRGLESARCINPSCIYGCEQFHTSVHHSYHHVTQQQRGESMLQSIPWKEVHEAPALQLSQFLAKLTELFTPKPNRPHTCFLTQKRCK
jgi:hypothetical protein